MATISEVLVKAPTQNALSSRVKTQVARFGKAARDWARKGQLGSSASVEMGRHSGARI